MATTKAATISVLTTSTDVPCPTDSDDQCLVTNFGANNIWIQHVEDVVAVVDGENCEVVLPGGQTYLQWRPVDHPYAAIAETGTTKINIVNRQGR